MTWWCFCTAPSQFRKPTSIRNSKLNLSIVISVSVSDTQTYMQQYSSANPIIWTYPNKHLRYFRKCEDISLSPYPFPIFPHRWPEDYRELSNLGLKIESRIIVTCGLIFQFTHVYGIVSTRAWFHVWEQMMMTTTTTTMTMMMKVVLHGI